MSSIVRGSYGSLLWACAAKWAKERLIVIFIDKIGSKIQLVVELRRLEVRNGWNKFLMYLGSSDNKGLGANKNIINSIPASTWKKHN